MKKYAVGALGALKNDYRRDRARFALRWTVVLLSVAILFLKPSIWTPDTLLVGLLIVGVVFGSTREFLVRFVPFLGLLVVYDSMRGLADDLNTHVHYLEMINFDKWLFAGHLPTVELQRWLWHGHVSWYDFSFYALYMIHFVTPVIVGLILWKKAPRLYWPYVWSVVGISFLAFFIYLIFPAAPPWLASQMSYINDPFHRISSDVWAAIGVNNFSELYKSISPNEVAAVPSLHSAYPLISALFIIRAFSFRKTWWILLYPVSMWVGVVYLGEHYVFDIVAAVVVVAVGMFAVQRGFRYYRARHPEHWWQRVPYIGRYMV